MLEAFAIRLSYILFALSPKKRPGLCPAKCSEQHTYRWPCRARERYIKPEPKSDVEWIEQTQCDEKGNAP